MRTIEPKTSVSAFDFPFPVHGCSKPLAFVEQNIGYRPVSFGIGTTTYYLALESDVENSGPLPFLTTDRSKAYLYRQIVSFPGICMKCDCPKEFHPQFVFLGENFSGSRVSPNGMWRNGYGEQCDLFDGTPLAGGYFTDFFKLYNKCGLTREDLRNISKEKILFGDGSRSNFSLAEICLNVFLDELKMLEDTFGLTAADTKIVFVWGTKLWDELVKYVPCFQEKIRAQGWAFRVFGLHYSSSRRNLCFRKDLGKEVCDPCKLSRGRVYLDAESVKLDRKNQDDRARYEFAIAEGKIVKGRGFKERT